MIVGEGLIPGFLIGGGLSRYDLGAGLLIGYEFANGLNANLNYNHGMLNVAANSTSYQKLKKGTRVLVPDIVLDNRRLHKRVREMRRKKYL